MLREIDLYEPADLEMFIEVLKHFQDKGYQYIARDTETNSIICYSARPKKYYVSDGRFFWGYHDKDLSNAKPAHPIWFDAPGIKNNSKSATIINDWLKANEVE